MLTPVVKAPLRICLAGEHLDWLGGRSVCVAINRTVDLRMVDTSGAGTDVDLGLYRELFTKSAPAVVIPERGPACELLTNPHPGSGLASSSAVALGIATALRIASGEDVAGAIEQAFTYEYALDHGGGMDHQAITLGGYVLTTGRDGALPQVLARRSPEPTDLAYLLIDSKIRKHSGSVLVGLRAAHARHDPVIDRYMARTDEVAGDLWRALTCGDLEQVCVEVNAAHEEMAALPGVTLPELERLRRDLLTFGLPAVKISGSGGGGCLVAPVRSAEVVSTAAAISAEFSAVEITATAPNPVGVEYAP